MSTSFHNRQIMTNGLVFAVDAGNTKSYVDGETTSYDLIKNGNNGTLTNGVTFEDGAWVFDGVDDHINCGLTNNFLNYSTSTPFTIECWFKLDASNQTGALLGDLDQIGPDDQGIMWQYSEFSKTVAWFLHDPGLPNPLRKIVGTGGYGELQTEVWYHLVGTYDGSNDTSGMIMYLYGVNVTSYGDNKATVNINPNRNWHIGKVNRGPVARFKGQISQVRVYNRELSASEVLQNYNATKHRFI